MIQPANRVTEIQEYYFSRKLKEVAKLNAEGMDIISLAIGSPDMPPSQQTIDKLCEVANEPGAHGYQPTVGIPELRKAMAGFYKRWYDVDLDWATEIQPLIGSKEGILHVTLAFCNPGERYSYQIRAILPILPSTRYWVLRLPIMTCVRIMIGNQTLMPWRKWTSVM